MVLTLLIMSSEGGGVPWEQLSEALEKLDALRGQIREASEGEQASLSLEERVKGLEAQCELCRENIEKSYQMIRFLIQHLLRLDDIVHGLLVESLFEQFGSIATDEERARVARQWLAASKRE